MYFMFMHLKHNSEKRSTDLSSLPIRSEALKWWRNPDPQLGGTQKMHFEKYTEITTEPEPSKIKRGGKVI